MAPRKISYDPVTRLQERFSMNTAKGLLLQLRKVIVDSQLNTESIKEYLSGEEFQLFFNDAQQIMGIELLEADQKLSTLVEVLHRGLTSSGFTRKYALQQACDEAYPQSDVVRVTEEPLCNFFQINEPTTESYILESEFRETKEYKENRIEICPDCEGHVSLLSTSNVIVPQDDAIVKKIISRVKTEGGRYAKLVEVLSFGFSEEQRIRNIDDYFAFSLILPNVDNYKSEKRKKLVTFVRDYYDEGLLRHCGINPPSQISLTDKFHYGLFCYVLQKMDENSVKLEAIDDYIAYPKLKGDTKKSLWKALHGAASFKGVPMEFQIKTDAMHKQEYDPSSPLFHPSYSVRRARERMQRWKEPHWALYNALRGLEYDTMGNQL